MKTYEGSQPYVFLSYAHLDSAKVTSIFRSLDDNGYRMWYDGGIEAGTEWPDYIAEHLERSGCFLAFMTKNYLASKNCRQEINYALDLDIPILVIYMEDVTLTGGLRMRLGMVQALFHHRYASEAAFLEALFRSALLTPCRGNRQQSGSSQGSCSAATPPTRAVPPVGSAASVPPSRPSSPVGTSAPVYRAPATPVVSAPSSGSTGGVFVSGNSNSVTVSVTGNGGSYSGSVSSGTSAGAASPAPAVIRSGQVYRNTGVMQGATVERGGTLINSGIISGGVQLVGGTLQNSGIVSGAVTGTGFLRNSGTVTGGVSSDVTWF